MARVRKSRDLNPNYMTDTKCFMEMFSNYEKRVITGQSPMPTDYDLELLRNMVSRITNLVIIFENR